MAKDLEGKAQTQQGRPPFLGISGNFIAAMESVTELATTAVDHVSALDELSAAVQRDSSRRMPSASSEQHEAAAAAVIQFFETTFGDGGDGDDGQSSVVNDDPLGEMLESFEEMFPGMGPDTFFAYMASYVKASSRPSHKSVLLASLLTTAVGNFEVHVGAVIREFLRLRPEAIRSDEAKFSLAEIEGYETLEEFRAHCAERYADTLLRGGFDEWIEWFRKLFKIELSDVSRHPDELREIFQRRHLIVHNGSIVNRAYISKMSVAPSAGIPELGAELVVTEQYLERAADLLYAAGVHLQAAVMRKLLNADDDGDHPSDALMCGVSFDALVAQRWPLALWISDHNREKCSADATKLVLQVNSWLAVKTMNGIEAIREEVERWQVIALAPRYALAKLALLGNLPEAHELGKKLLATEQISASDWLTWPLLADVRRYDAGVIEP